MTSKALYHFPVSRKDQSGLPVGHNQRLQPYHHSGSRVIVGRVSRHLELEVDERGHPVRSDDVHPDDGHNDH